MAGTLYIVATPIGNLEDITLRALRTLKEVALVAAEDTRRTGNLLRHYGIDTPLISLHEHNEYRRAEDLLRRLHAGDSVALVSDAGTPGISDPGAKLVRTVRSAGLKVEPIPGPSAVTAVLSASGLSFERFVFAGFPPTRSKDRKKWFAWVSQLEDVPVVCFEAPHRVRRTLDEIGQILVDRPIIVARELTKLHEEWSFGALGSTKDPIPEAKGEYALIISPKNPTTEAVVDVPDQEIGRLFGQITENEGVTRRNAIRAVAQRLGLSANTVYAALERAKVVPVPTEGPERQ